MEALIKIAECKYMKKEKRCNKYYDACSELLDRHCLPVFKKYDQTV